MKILLISPTWKKTVTAKRLKRDRIFKFPPHSLLAVAALTPEDIEVEMMDENIEELDFNRGADLVGITTMTASGPRAYEIADEFRKRKISVVIGGMHATAGGGVFQPGRYLGATRNHRHLHHERRTAQDLAGALWRARLVPNSRLVAR